MKVGRVFLSSTILLSFLIIIWRKNVFFGHLTSEIVLSEQEDTSALSQEKWRSGMRGSYVSMHARSRRFLAARIPLYPNSSVHFNATRLVISGDVSPNPGPGGTRPNTNLSQGSTFSFQSKRIALLSFECEVITCTPGWSRYFDSPKQSRCFCCRRNLVEFYLERPWVKYSRLSVISTRQRNDRCI